MDTNRIMKVLMIFLILCLSGCRNKDDAVVKVQTEIMSEIEESTDDNIDMTSEAASEESAISEEMTEEQEDGTVQTTQKFSDDEIDEVTSVNFSSMNADDGVYYLINEIKGLGKTSGAYISGFGTTAYLLISGYIAANPDSRWNASLEDVMAIAKEMYDTETAMKKLNKAYDYPLEVMYEYSKNVSDVQFNIISKYEESYSDDLVGWLENQYDSFTNVGKRPRYYGMDSAGDECIVMPEEMLSQAGEQHMSVAVLDSVQVEENGFAKELKVYYEISDELGDSIANDYEAYKEYESELLLKQTDLENMLNEIE